MAKLTKLEEEAFSYFTQTYSRLKNLNKPYHDKFDTYDEFYGGYRSDTKYPFAYNYSFNKIIPVIYTILSNFMSQLYRNQDIVVVKPKSGKDIFRADIIQGVLTHQLTNMNDVDYQGGSYLVFLMWFLHTLVHGKGVLRAYWRKEEATVPFRRDIQIPIFEETPYGIAINGMENRSLSFEQTQTIYDAPYLENIPNRNFFPDPEYRSIQKMPCIAHLHKKSLDWVMDQADKGVYKHIKKIGRNKDEYKRLRDAGATDTDEALMKYLEIEGGYSEEEIATNRHAANNIDIVDFYGKYSLHGPIYDMDNKINWKREDEVVATIVNHDTIVQLAKNKYGVRPFFDIGAHLNMSRYWDVGVVEIVKDILEAYNNMANLRLHNSMMRVNTMIKVLRDSDINPEHLVWKPFGVIPVDTHEDIEILETPDMAGQTFREQMQFFESVIQDVTGIYDYSKGVTPERQERVGTVYSLQEVAQARTKLLLMTMDYMGIRPLLKYMCLLNSYHLPSGTEYRIAGKKGAQQFGRVFSDALHFDYDFEAKYAAMEPALAKEGRIQNLLQYSQLWQQDPMVNHYQFKRAILELMEFTTPEMYLKDPKQFAQEQAQQAAQQEAMMMKQLLIPNKGKTDVAQIKADSDLRTTQIEAETDLQIANKKMQGDILKQLLLPDNKEKK